MQDSFNEDEAISRERERDPNGIFPDMGRHLEKCYVEKKRTRERRSEPEGAPTSQASSSVATTLGVSPAVGAQLAHVRWICLATPSSRNGIKQRKNYWQDGVLGTNCLILPNSNFTYKFQTKDQIGTYTYFPSTIMHKAAGGFGGLNVYARSVTPTSERTLDAPNLLNDYYLNFLD
ncbi:uncharacterized protein LOC130757442 [Actinidia eriantha]|uniref:uncharacterized protein LOC130757442 n=1 Tax=Actinidia eriantha TaxID=165200 RepID=UPI00258D6347|nr:uncharacterized protein LOC130757442 [Actinidia eriantha]